MSAVGPAAPAAPGAPFDRPYPVVDGVVRTLERLPRLSPAQRSNLLAPTAALYEPLWRRRSLGLLSGGAVTTAEELDELRAWAADLGGGRLLDLGASSGLYARTAAAADPRLEVHALEVSPAFLRSLRHRAAAEGIALVAVHGDAERLPYRDDAFDGAMVGGTLNELRDPRRALAELGRVVRPGGRLWLMFLIAALRRRGRALQRLAAAGGVTFPGEDEVLGWADAAGFEPLERKRWAPVVIARFARREGSGEGSG